MRIKGISSEDLLQQHLKNPQFRAEWERTTLARAVAIAVIRYRAERKLSQAGLAKLVGMSQSNIARLEIGEHNPSVDMLQRLAKGLGLHFILSVAPDGTGDLSLPPGVEVLSDVTSPDGSRVLAAVG